MTDNEREQLVLRIKNFLALINEDLTDIEQAHTGLIDFVINVTIDRVLLYLNSDTIPTIVERLIAEVVNNGLTQKLDVISGNDKAISSISDNGQSISFANETKKYFASASDNEIFGAFTNILNRYRRIKVVCTR